jgi:hypothetical protein
MDPDRDPRHPGERIRILKKNNTDPYGSRPATLITNKKKGKCKAKGEGMRW